MCSFNGKCKYNTFTKKHYCECDGIRAGKNCTFKNKTEIEMLKNLTFGNSLLFSKMSMARRLLEENYTPNRLSSRHLQSGS